jgi:hypothetical protein
MFPPQYPLDSFFRTADTAQDLENVLADNSKKVIIFVGAGGNGKSQLCEQIRAAQPDKFSVYHADETEALPELVMTDVASGRRALIVANEVSSLNLRGIEGHVVFMDRTFGSLTPDLRAHV